MLRLFLNGKLFWSANIEECPSQAYGIFSLNTSQTIDDIGTMEFTILKTHPMYSEIRLKRSTFLLHDGEVLFFGKVSDIVMSYDFRVSVTVKELFDVFKDDFNNNYWSSSEVTTADKLKINTMEKNLDRILTFVNNPDTYSTVGLNSAWPNLPKITKGFIMTRGESSDIHDFSIGEKSFYEVLYDEIPTYCGGFWRMRVTGSLTKTNNVVSGFTVKKIYIDYLSDESDYQLDPNTGLLYVYDDVGNESSVVILSDILDDPQNISTDDSSGIIEISSDEIAFDTTGILNYVVGRSPIIILAEEENQTQRTDLEYWEFSETLSASDVAQHIEQSDLKVHGLNVTVEPTTNSLITNTDGSLLNCYYSVTKQGDSEPVRYKLHPGINKIDFDVEYEIVQYEGSDTQYLSIGYVDLSNAFYMNFNVELYLSKN